ncbi:MAG: N-acetylmuramoyl-L-alanine amidase [Clostridia bacterium]|nr:N-acetylmuramoyl-L-alanine amidase [Clostridia bacterium]
MPKQSITIDPGHGGTDPGAVYENYLEKDWTLDISLHMAEELRKHGHPVSLTRVTDIRLTASQRAKLVRESGTAVCISNHINSGGGEGAEVIYSLHDERYLAALILEELAAAGMKKRRVYTRESTRHPGKDYYYIHRDTRPIETVIIEYGFIDNSNDRAKLSKPEFRKELAAATVRGITEYLALAEPKPPLSASVMIIDQSGRKIEFPKEKTQIIQGNTYLEGRELTNILGGKARWDADSKTATFDFKR